MVICIIMEREREREERRERERDIYTASKSPFSPLMFQNFVGMFFLIFKHWAETLLVFVV